MHAVYVTERDSRTVTPFFFKQSIRNMMVLYWVIVSVNETTIQRSRNEVDKGI